MCNGNVKRRAALPYAIPLDRVVPLSKYLVLVALRLGKCQWADIRVMTISRMFGATISNDTRQCCEKYKFKGPFEWLDST